MVARNPGGTTEFRIHKPGVRQVYLVGDFIDGQERSLPMAREGEADWVCRLQLPEGVYRFRYLADGEWHSEQGCPGVGWAPFDCNSITILNSRSAPALPVG